jgi:hypothetical protein
MKPFLWQLRRSGKHARGAVCYGVDVRSSLIAQRLLTSAEAPRLIRLPGIIALSRALVLFSVIVLQVANLWPTTFSGPFRGPVERAFRSLGDWAGGMEMEMVCWRVFLSVCAGLASSGLAEGLELR